MRADILVATSPKQAKALRAQGASSVIRTSFTHTEIIIPVQGGGTTVLWRPFSTRKVRKCGSAWRVVQEAYRSTAR